jgi:hypothetical protein
MFNCEHVSYLTCVGVHRLSYLEVTNNLLESITTSSDHFLHDIAKVVDQEVQCLSILCNGSELCIVSKSSCVDIAGYLQVHQLRQ